MPPSDAPCLLALDSATERVAVALVIGDRHWAADEPGGARASERLLPMAFELLAHAGVEGRSVHLVVVELDGKISQYALIDSSGSELLDKAALTFLSAIRLSPGTLDGVPTRMTMIMPVAFTLPGSRK